MAGLGRVAVLGAVLGAALALLAVPGPVRAGEVRVAVASNFAATLARIADGFTARTGHQLKVSSGATGKLYAQIVGGAPFDVLLAADDETPRRLVAQGQAMAGSQFTYALGALVLWSRQPGLVDADGALLAGPGFRHLAIANPKTAPYGRAAMQVLRARGLDQALAPRLVTGESIAQAFQFVATGNAEVGFIALAQLAQLVELPGEDGARGGSMWRVPAALHAPIRQDAVLLRHGAGQPAALALLDYLKTDAVRAMLREQGYGP